MGEFSDEILGLIPQLLSEKDAADAAAREQEEQRRQEQEARRQAETSAEEQYRALGREIVDLLQRNGVPTLPIYERINRQGPVTHTGDGWHVASIKTFQGTEAPPGSQSFGIRDDGTVLAFRHMVYQGDGNHRDPRGKRYEGIVFPDASFTGRRALGMLTTDTFKHGIASLIATREPYDDQTVFDY